MDSGVSSQNIQEEVHQLFSHILVEQKKINSIRPPEDNKKHLVEELINEFTPLRGRGFFFPYFSSGRGHGPFTELIDGSVKYDLICAMGVNLLGHSHPIYIKSLLESACRDVLTCGNLLPYGEPLELSKAIVNAVKEKSRLKHFWFAGSGSFANDNALKMIWQKKSPKYKVLAFTKSFAGRSIATQNITHNESYRENMPQAVDVTHIPYPEDLTRNGISATLKLLEAAWKESSEQFCCFYTELIQGEGGINFLSSEVYREIFSWAKSKNLYIWVDEVQSFARTTELFAFQTFELDEFVDVVTVGKALQCCGTLFTEELNPKPGLIAGTFSGSLANINAGEKTIKYLLEGEFFGPEGRIKKLEKKITALLTWLSKNSCHGLISNITSIGTMISFCIKDGDREETQRFLIELFNAGIIAFSAGKNPSKVRFLLPLCLTDEHIRDISNIIEKTLLSQFKES